MTDVKQSKADTRKNPKSGALQFRPIDCNISQGVDQARIKRVSDVRRSKDDTRKNPKSGALLFESRDCNIRGR